MTLIDNIFQDLYNEYGLSKSEIVKCTNIPYAHIRERKLDEHQEDKFYKFYYDLELYHSLLENNDRSQTSGWFFSPIDKNIPYSPADFYIREGRKSIVDIIIAKDYSHHVKNAYPQYVRGPEKFQIQTLYDGERSIVVKYEQFSA